MYRIPPVEDVMSSFPPAVEAETPVIEALRLMARLGTRHLPVVQQGELFGILTDREVSEIEEDSKELPVSKICNTDVLTAQSGERLDRVLMRMIEHKEDHVVVTAGRKLAGIFTVTDVCRAFIEFLQVDYEGPEESDLVFSLEDE